MCSVKLLLLNINSCQSFDHLDRLEIEFFMVVTESDTIELQSFTSSAKSLHEIFSMSGKSLINNKNKIRDSTEPWGTSDRTDIQGEKP